MKNNNMLKAVLMGSALLLSGQQAFAEDTLVRGRVSAGYSGYSLFIPGAGARPDATVTSNYMAVGAGGTAAFGNFYVDASIK